MAATNLLEPLLRQPGTNSELRSAMARIYLQAGHVAEAERLFARVAEDPEVSQANKDMNAALLASARGEWETSRVLLEGLIEGDKENFAVRWFVGSMERDTDGLLLCSIRSLGCEQSRCGVAQSGEAERSEHDRPAGTLLAHSVIDYRASKYSKRRSRPHLRP